MAGKLEGFSLLEVLAVLAIFGLLSAVGVRGRAAPSESVLAALEAFLTGAFQRAADDRGMDYALLVGDGPPRDPQSRRLLLARKRTGPWEQTDCAYQLPQRWRIISPANQTVPMGDRSRFPAMAAEGLASIPGRWIAIELPVGRPPREAVLIVIDDGGSRRIRSLRLSDYAYQTDEE